MGSLKTFDQKFGPKFLAGVPNQPAVYRIYDDAGTLIYVGKAKNLRRRLQQYRNAKRRKRHHKMRAIVKAAARLDYIPCPTELEALLLETRLIQEHRPRFNVEGAFYFLYPMIGVRRDQAGLHFCFTTKPDEAEGFQLHGAYRSRHFAGEAFFSLMKLLARVGHKLPSKRARNAGSRTYFFGFRRLPESWEPMWSEFFRGESRRALETLILSLVEDAGARKDAESVQDQINALARFHRYEALPLLRARTACGITSYPIPQRERDVLFLKARHGSKPKPAHKAAKETPCVQSSSA